MACTPSAPWLKISNDGALYRQGGGVPFAASCLVTAVQGNMNHTLKAGKTSPSPSALLQLGMVLGIGICLKALIFE